MDVIRSFFEILLDQKDLSTTLLSFDLKVGNTSISGASVQGRKYEHTSVYDYFLTQK